MLTDNLPAALDRLVSLGQTRDVNIRPVLLRVLVDMFVNKPSHSDDAIRQFEEIVSRLIEEADDAAKLIIAAKLAHHPLTPTGVLRRLIADRGAVAGTILAHARLDSQTLLAAAGLGTTEMARAVARRPDLDHGMARALAERPEMAVLCALLENPAAPIDAGLHRYLVRRARENTAVATKLLARTGETSDIAALFLAATSEQRMSIIVAARRQDLGRSARRETVPGAAEALMHIKRVVLLPGMDGLDLALCRAFGLSAADVGRVIDDPSGEPLAVCLAALGASPELAARVFILGHPAIGHHYARVKALAGIVETLSPAVARRLVAVMTGADLPLHRPAAAQSERPAERIRPAAQRQSRQPEVGQAMSTAKAAG